MFHSNFLYLEVETRKMGRKQKRNKHIDASFARQLTLPFSYQSLACWRDRTLQSKMALFGSALSRATARPTLTGSFNGIERSWNGCEFGRQRKRQLGKAIGDDDDKLSD